MRRLILEISEKELTKAGIELPPLMKIKSLELLYFLRQDAEEFAAISRVVNASCSNKLTVLWVLLLRITTMSLAR